MSVKRVHNVIKEFADRCVFISDYAEGDYDDIMDNGDNDFPLLFLNPVNVTTQQRTQNFKVQIHLLDYATNNKEVNETRLTQKMHNVATILKIWLDSLGDFTPESFTANTIYNFGRDRVHGVMIDFDVNLPIRCKSDVPSIVI